MVLPDKDGKFLHGGVKTPPGSDGGGPGVKGVILSTGALRRRGVHGHAWPPVRWQADRRWPGVPVREPQTGSAPRGGSGGGNRTSSPSPARAGLVVPAGGGRRVLPRRSGHGRERRVRQGALERSRLNAGLECGSASRAPLRWADVADAVDGDGIRAVHDSRGATRSSGAVPGG